MIDFKLIKAFSSPEKFREWLVRNHARADVLWLRIFKKNSGKKTVTYAEALDEALCHGWIDGQKQSGDEMSYLQKFTPRRVRSGWSKKNTEHAARLIETGRMQAAGQREINRAKDDGRWKLAYDSPRNAEPPEEFLNRLEKNKTAKKFFATLSRQNRYSIVYRLQTAKKPETLERRMETILKMLEKGETFHPQNHQNV
jgi:uncharacterized protein YdeI (YjbR/CyaY-like superfamily)